GGNAIIGAVVPMSNFGGATISAFVASPAPGNFAALTATCAPRDQFGDVKVTVLADFGVQPGGFRRGIIRCQPGYYAFGGGGYFTTADNNGVLWASDNVSNAPTADGN